MERREPDVSFVSSLVPTFNMIPKSTLVGTPLVSVSTVTPLLNFETWY